MRARGYLAVTILAAWGAGVLFFARREARRSPLERLAEVALRVAPGATWLAIERAGRQIGFASITVDTLPRELQITEYVVVDTSAGSGGERHVEQTTIHLSRALVLREFEQMIAAAGDSSHLRGRAVDDSSVTYVLERRERRDSSVVTHKGPLFLTPLVPVIAALQQSPRIGNTVDIDVLDLEEKTSRTMRVRTVAESLFVISDSAAFDRTTGRWVPARTDSVPGWRLHSLGDAAVDIWIDRLGQVLESRTPNGVVRRRTAFELAFENWRLANPGRGVSARGGNVISSTMLAAGAVPSDAILDTMRLRVRSGPRFALALGPGFRTGNLLISARPLPAALLADYTLAADKPPRGSRVWMLRREPGIEVDDPRIVRLATRLRGTASDPLVVAQAILSWVHDSIVKDAGAAPLGAAQVVESRRGDCTEHARAFVALARAAGIPARGAAGLLYASGKFYYHAWAEVNLGKRFVAVDPMLGQFPADAAHLRWMSGSLELQTELMRLMGGLDLQVVGVTTVHELGGQASEGKELRPR